MTMKTLIFILAMCVSTVKCEDERCRYIQPTDAYQVVLVNDRCYHMVQDSVSWTEAASRCRARNSTLAIVRDSETNNQLNERARNLDFNDRANVSFYWIGGRVETDGAAITWERDLNGDAVVNSFTAYGADQPEGSGEMGCLLLDPAEIGWFTDFCAVPLDLTGYVCELEPNGSMSHMRAGISKLMVTFLLTVVLGHVV